MISGVNWDGALQQNRHTTGLKQDYGVFTGIHVLLYKVCDVSSHHVKQYYWNCLDICGIC
jgi:hypothetical protein